MTRHFQKEIENLKKNILTLGALVEERVQGALRAIEKRDSELAKVIVEGDPEIDEMEVAIEEECLKVLALHQPVAGDLRFIVAVLKINSDLERIGDLAVNMAERAFQLASLERTEELFEIPHMAVKVKEMLKQSLDALVNHDAALARHVCDLDDAVDKDHGKMFDQIKAALRKAPAQVERLINLLSVSRYLERIADHATNIAEDVIYMMEGEIVRHQG